MLEISAGGIVNAGETLEQAIIREVKEELGLDLREGDLKLFSVEPWNHHHPKLKKHTKVFLHSYVVKVDIDSKDIVKTVNDDETLFISAISLRKAKNLVRLGRLKNLGRLTPANSYWRKCVAAAKTYLSNN